MLFLLFISLGSISAQSEGFYAKIINESFNGQLEYKLKGGRADLVTEQYAIEIDFAKKWKESIGQSLWYGIQSKRKPGIILILQSPKDYKHAVRLQSTVNESGLKDIIKVWLFPIDFGISYENINQRIADCKINIECSSEKQYWLSKNSKVRHNYNCNQYKISKGKACYKEEGRACGICGG